MRGYFSGLIQNRKPRLSFRLNDMTPRSYHAARPSAYGPMRSNPTRRRDISGKTTSGPHVFRGRTDEKSVTRFASFIAVALLLAACGDALSDKAQETMSSYKAAQESSLRSIANAR